ncbi:thylakoid membrane photosystem I accumulation factor [Cronbergia sp. UHCC 0137]|uniref:thylakoid membrane photosystem I accumulation factor n=1 Tax=Cronbergia sp. UHCC 0137 TaxID=3110239 RepID=UPI002B2010C9|nr:thylakoid membrane photosystem I accumulation factor [Cronbergia sp. UHCC 0137]MEA5620960.1 thylakoid membrane photosystem I accumulation factor [Cronbergia sp. UHCC 0137]
MNSIKWLFLQIKIIANGWRLVSKCLLLLVCLFLVSVQPALAGLKEDSYDGNIFVIYAGNGSLVPSKQTLGQALAAHKPVFLAFYVDDSTDCKEYAIAISQVQAFYGRVAEIIPIGVDTIPVKETYDPTEPGYYYQGAVPQVLVFNQSGEVVLNKQGQVPFEEIDDKFRQIFNLLPRTESVPLKRRSFNEFSSELN